MLSPNLTPAAPPVFERKDAISHCYKITLSDPYAWLRAENWQEVLRAPQTLPKDIRHLIDAENAHADAVMAPTVRLQKQLLREMRGRIQEETSEVPQYDGPFAYYSRFREGGQHALYCRSPREGGEEQMILDGDSLAAGTSFFDLGSAFHSPDHKMMWWSADVQGSEFYSIRVRDLASLQDLPDVLEETDGHAVWSADARALYYVKMDANHRPTQVWRHRLGTAQSSDELIYEEQDSAWFVSLERSDEGHHAILTIKDHDSSECHLIDLRENDGRPQLIAARSRGLRYSVGPYGAQLIMQTNADEADDGKLMVAELANPAQVWRELVPYRAGRMIEHFSLFQHYLVRLEKENSLPRIVIRDMRDGREHAIEFAEQAYALDFEEMLEFGSAMLRFSYESPTTPEEIYDYNMETRERVLRKRQIVPSGHNAADYVTRRIYATAKDGEQVPITLLYAKGCTLPAPTLLYGYGSYGHSLSASFSTNRLSLVDRGFVFAIAHVRGGTDKGWAWYKGGKLEHKTNTFSDFIACAEHLIGEGFTQQGRIVAQGGSAGGMLMGVVANWAPQLFAGIVADVPFVDVLNTMLDDTLPLTPPEWLEWGNPIKDEAAFHRMRAYSPYDNVTAQKYPPMLVLAGLTDPRVTYWEPLKWVAKLRATMQDGGVSGGPILLKTNVDAGHAGASGRFDQLEEVALIQAFALAVCNQSGEL